MSAPQSIFKKPKYDAEARRKRGEQNAAYLDKFLNLRGKRVLEIGPQLGDVSTVLARDYDCEVIGIDTMSHPNWPEIHENFSNIKLFQGDIADPPAELADNSFDAIFSFVVFEHIRHPWSALSQCQRLLKPTGKKFIRANLYRSSIASHEYRRIDEPWPHLMYSPDELKAKLRVEKLGWAYWVNKLTYQQYLYYFRQLGFFITHEKFDQVHFDSEYYDTNEHRLGLYPQWDLKTDFFEVLLEFDKEKPKQSVFDPVYSKLNP